MANMNTLRRPRNASLGSAYPETDLTALTLALLVDPAEIAAYIATQLAAYPFAAEKILGGRQSNALGIFPVRQFETLDVTGEAETVAPTAEYPLVQVGDATVKALSGTKEGFKRIISDERMGQTRGADAQNQINSLVNQLRYQADANAMSVIASAATPTFDAGSWASVSGVIEGLMNAVSAMQGLRMGFNPSLFVVNPTQYNRVIALFVEQNKLATVQEAQELLVSAGIPTPVKLNGLPDNWAPLLVDPTYFGSIGHWEIPSPEYSAVAGTTVEVASSRLTADGAPRDATVVQIRQTDTPYVEIVEAGLSLTVAWS